MNYWFSTTELLSFFAAGDHIKITNVTYVTWVIILPDTPWYDWYWRRRTSSSSPQRLFWYVVTFYKHPSKHTLSVASSTYYIKTLAYEF